MASSRSESASSAPVGSTWWIQLNIPLKITAKCHGQYRYFIVFPLIRVSRVQDGFCLDDWGSGEEDNTHPMMHLSLNGAYLLSFYSFFFSTAGDELLGEWIRMRRSLIPSLFLLWQTTHGLIGTHSEVKGDWKTSSRDSEAQNEIVCCRKTTCLFVVCSCFLTPSTSARLQRPHARKESKGHHGKHLKSNIKQQNWMSSVYFNTHLQWASAGLFCVQTDHNSILLS